MLAVLLQNNASEGQQDTSTFNVGPMGMFAYMLEARLHSKTRLTLLAQIGHVRSSNHTVR